MKYIDTTLYINFEFTLRKLMEIELISIIRTLEHIKNIVVLKSDFEFHFLLMDVDM